MHSTKLFITGISSMERTIKWSYFGFVNILNTVLCLKFCFALKTLIIEFVKLQNVLGMVRCKFKTYLNTKGKFKRSNLMPETNKFKTLLMFFQTSGNPVVFFKMFKHFF